MYPRRVSYINKTSATTHTHPHMQHVMCMLPPNIDTAETVHNKCLEYRNMRTESGAAPFMTVCTNIQKDDMRGLTGYTVDMSASDKLHALDTVSDHIFGGISVVQCFFTEEEVIECKKNRDDIQQRLDAVCKKLSSRSKGNMSSIEELVPLGDTNDFYWLNQTVQFISTMQVLSL